MFAINGFNKRNKMRIKKNGFFHSFFAFLKKYAIIIQLEKAYYNLGVSWFRREYVWYGVQSTDLVNDHQKISGNRTQNYAFAA